jgi:uncharacterized membrane protein
MTTSHQLADPKIHVEELSAKADGSRLRIGAFDKAAQEIAVLFERYLPILYITVALPVVIFLAIARQPLSVADEWSHVARAAQLADGIIFTERAVKDLPPLGSIDPEFQKLKELVHQHRRTRLSEVLDHYESFRWSKNRVLTIYNSSVYFPAAFFPQVLYVLIGRQFDLGIVQTLRVGSLLNGILCVLIAAMALHLMRSGRNPLFVVLSLPMTLFQFASFSPDGLLIVSGALTAASVSNLWSHDKAPSYAALSLLALCGALLCATKIVYMPLILFATLAVGLHPRATIPFRRLAALSFVSTVLISVLWHKASRAGQVNHWFVPGISQSDQIAFLLSNPLAITKVVAETFSAYSWTYVEQAIGTLGWLDAPISHTGTITLAVCFLIAAAGDLASRRSRIPKSISLVLAAAILVSMGGVFLGLYLIGNPVGSVGPIQGVQGRYFLPIIPFMILLLPSLADCGFVRVLARASLAIAAFVTQIEVIRTIISRYYL